MLKKTDAQAKACATLATWVAQALACALFCLPAAAQVVDIGVFSLFHPLEMRVTPASNTLLVTTDDRRVILEGHQGFPIQLAHLSSTVRVSARDGSPTDFSLSIPGKIERKFHGTLAI